MSIPKEKLAVIALALAFDRLGEPPAKIHPVVWYGKLIKFLEKQAPCGRAAQLVYGGVMLTLAAPVAILPALGLQKWLNRKEQIQTRLGKAFFSVAEAALLKPFFALNMLVEAGRTVRRRLEFDDLARAREALQSLVSRDRSRLTAELVAAAAVESLAENLSDSVVAPLFYYAGFGLPGAAAYRLFNTFDAMIGYHGEYEYLGKAAARLDDLLNLLPSRLTALLITGLAPLYGGDMAGAWHTWRSEAHLTTSPNAGQPMAAAAGALRVQLEKTGHYKLGQPLEPLTPETIAKAERMVWVAGLVAAGLVGLGASWRERHRRQGKYSGK